MNIHECTDLKTAPKEMLRSLQIKELEILMYFDSFCKAHNLRYYLAGGTLIGAVRHKGFIPWDDDVDVHMPRPDYERLKCLWPQYADKKYHLCYSTEELNYRHQVYSICDTTTTYIERKKANDDVAQGVIIDILVFDGVPDNKLLAAIQFFWAIVYSIYNVQRLPENQGGRFMKLSVKLALAIVPSKSIRYKIWKFAEGQVSKYDFEKMNWVRELEAPLKSMFFKYPRENFEHAVYLEFEGAMLPAQHYYKDYLKNVYHDYMNMPPADSRVPKSDVVYINLEEGYLNYRGIYYCCEKVQGGNNVK